MEEILRRIKMPSAPLTRDAIPPLATAEVSVLIDRLKDEPTFRGVWTLDATGAPVAILHALDAKNFAAANGP